MGRVPRRVVVGIALILAGVAAYLGTDHWMRTRIVSPVNMPISLAAGHIHTGPFRLNLNAAYWVEVGFGEGWYPELKCTYRYPRTQTRWVLYKDGRIFDHNDNPTFVGWPTRFDAGSGVYDLDVEVLWDTSCMDPSHPRLRVLALTQNYEIAASLLRALCLAAIGFGLVLLVFLPAVQRAYSLEPTAAAVGSIETGHNYQWACKLPLRPRISGLPSFGTYAALLYGTLAILIILLTALLQPPPPMGWWVHALKPGQMPEKSGRWDEPLLVSVRFTGYERKPDLFLNDNPLEWSELEKVLRDRLSTRRDWVVYVRGDDSVSFAEMARVIDTARGLRARVVLVTTR